MSLSSNIEEKLKEYRCRKEAEVKLSHYRSLWERFLGKLKISNENATVRPTCEVIENVSDCQKQSAVVNQAKDKEFRSSASSGKPIPKKLYSQKKAQSIEAELKKVSLSSTHSASMHQKTNHIFKESSNNDREFKWFLLFLKTVLWMVLYMLCLELECGAIYICVSAFYLIFTNFRNGKRKSWEPSAYSVFNPGCEAIDGTLKPEQFEKEIRYGF